MPNEEQKSALSRRAFVGRLAAGAGAAVTLAAGIGQARAMTTRGESGASSEGANPVQLGPEPQRVFEVPDPAAQAEYRGEKEPSAPAPWELLRPLAEGSTLAHGWRVAALTGVIDGSCVLTLANQRGRSHRVHLCRNDGRPQGLVYTERFDFVVMNGGVGDLPTEEGLAQAVAELAHVVASNEGRHAELETALLPQTERVKLYASAAALR